MTNTKVRYRGGYEKKARQQEGKRMEKSIKITYQGKHSEELDDKIIKAMDGIGYEMWACGYDLTTHARDLAFDKNNGTK